MKKIAVIQDLSGLGKCSLTAAIPVISAMGVQACPLPTAILSNQTGYESYFCDDYTDNIDQFIEEWKKKNFSPDGIYTGFLAGETQVELILKFIHTFQKAHTKILVDPVLADDGAVYENYSEALLTKMRCLVQYADVITPNLTEALLLLYGKEEMQQQYAKYLKYCKKNNDTTYENNHTVHENLSSCLNSPNNENETVVEDIEEWRQWLEQQGRQLREQFSLETVVITGIPFTNEKTATIANLVVTKETCEWICSKKYGGSYSGTGDLFASVLSAGMVKGERAIDSVKRAVRFLEPAIRDAVAEQTDHNDGVCFETYLSNLWN